MSNAGAEGTNNRELQGQGDEPIAIVGMAVDLPGAPTAGIFWNNLRDGIESIEMLDDDALAAAGESPERMRRKNYVRSAARLKGFDEFDAEFFGFSAKEAAILDPQHRKFMEVSWGALENAGHLPENFPGPIGVFAGCGMGSYLYFNLCSHPDLLDDVGMFLLRHTGNDKDFLATRISHILDLRGPSINIQTACSTSLVAVHYACNAIRQGDCDMALAGGVTIELPHGRGYLFKENEILSPDGHCHAFDHRAQGTVFGSGAGCIALRRLSDAERDGDHVWAVIRGSAVNNDGANKASYLAPSVDGQAAVVTKALENAGVAVETVDYMECHGTGTFLGDPIEVSALTEAFHKGTSARGFCRIGSVKTNIGHLDTAAGVASLVKTTLGLHHAQMPPSLNFEAPNPTIDFEASPFRVNDTLRDWDGRGSPRRAGINSLGVGGTNAHVILEEAPGRPASEQSDWPFHVICVSGRSKAALDANARALAAHLRAHPQQPLVDVAWTLRTGRRGFDKRRVLVAESHEEAAMLLESNDSRRVFTHGRLGEAPEVVFMFPGGGAQYVHMARDLYETEPVFAEWMDRGLDHLQAQLDHDIRALWLPEAGDETAAEARLRQPSVQLPLIMIVEYALAKLWISWGVKPAVLVGHSMGENTAACLAGVIAFEDCIDLVLLRGRLFDTVPKGGMLSVSLPADRLAALVGEDLDIASVNAPELSAVSGPDDKLSDLAERLDADGVEHQRIAIDIAAHSRMLDPILGQFRSFLQGVTLTAPVIPVMSNRTGALLTAEQATDADYWVAQLRERVEFGACVTRLAEVKGRVFLEVGPGKALSSLAQMNPAVAPAQVLSSLRHPEQDIGDDACFLGLIGRLWACGVEADWTQIWGAARRNRVPLPGYEFQRKRYFIEPGKLSAAGSAPALLEHQTEISDWGYAPVWKPRFADSAFVVDHDLTRTKPVTWAFFMDETGLAEMIAARLIATGHRVIRITPGDVTARIAEDRYTLAAEAGRTAYEALFEMLVEADTAPARIAHFWLVTQAERHRPGSSFYACNVEQGFMSLMHVAQALGNDAVHLSVITNGAEQLRDEALPHPEKALVAGPAGVIPHEFPQVTVATLDIDLPVAMPSKAVFRRANTASLDPFATSVLEELLAAPGNSRAVLRNGKRFELGYERAALTAPPASPLRIGGTYLITGGFGGIGLSVARDLLTRHQANVVLLSRGKMTARRKTAFTELEALDGEVMVVHGDVCNPQDMGRVASEIEARFGKLTGLFHAAGTIHDAPLLTKEPAEAEAVLAPKITGLRVLDDLYPDGSLEIMVLFSSSSTATRPAGQVDYVAANEYLNAFAKARKGAKTRVVSVNWGVWAEVGMAAEALAARNGTQVVDWQAAAHPLLDEWSETVGMRHYRTRLSAASHWIIDGHRTAAGDALMPGTGFVELAAAAAQLPLPLEISDLDFLRALDVPDGQTRDMHVTIAEGGAVEIASAVHVQGREGRVLNAQAHVAALAPREAAIDLVSIAARCPKVNTAPYGERIRAPQETHLTFGTRWHVLRETRLGKGEGLARLSLPQDCHDDLNLGYLLHPGLLDPATGWAMGLIPGYRGAHLWVPLSCRAIRVLRPLPAEVASWARLSEHGEGLARFDITLADAEGHICVEIDGFGMTRLAEAIGFGKAAAVAMSDVVFADVDAQGLSPEEERLQHNISQGIRQDEGPEALRRALATGRAEVIVSSLDLDGLIAQAEATDQRETTEAQGFERPDLEGDYLAPRTRTEQVLAGFWEKLLGVSPIGIEDSFFDLGGHSLIAVRLFAMIRKEFKTEFPISVLFEALTISACAALIDARTGAAGDIVAGPSESRPEAGPIKTGFTHLVALNRGAAGRAPLFIVAGMFGNVLNLRHLAQHLGPDQPVYGLQARGLIGDDEPHTRIEDAACDYLSEIRQIQPEGPYLLAGFSGGGITAYEMAHQVTAAGERVALLAMLDTPLPVRPELTRKDKALIKLAELHRKGPSYLKEWVWSRVQWELARRQVAGDSGQGFNNHKIEMAFREAVGSYTLRSWDQRMLLFRPPLDRHWQVSGGNWVSAAREYVFEDNQWRLWAPKTEVIEVTGDHDSMVLDPNVAVLARHIAGEIARLNAGRPVPVSGLSVAE